MRMGLVLAVLLGACGGGGTMSGDAGDTRQVVATVRATANRDIDILFVIDDSRSMAGRQAKLAASIGGLGRLVDAQGRLPNLHIGVITTDMGTTGSGVGAPGPQVGTIGEGGCALAGKDGVLQMKTPGVTGNFLRDIAQPNGTRMRNYTGNLEAVLGDMVTTGGIGCAFEQPLHAMKRALTPRPTNAGFLRPTAALGIFFLTDEDDCSARDPELFAPSEAKLGPVDSFRCTRYGVFCAQGGTTPDEMMQVGTKGSCMPSTTSTLLDDVATYRDFLLSLKPDPSQITLGGVMGPEQPFAVELRQVNGSTISAVAHSCAFDGLGVPEVADPAVRLAGLIDTFSGSSRSTICQADYHEALATFAERLTTAVGTPCLTRELADTSPAQLGLQPDCVVEERTGTTVTEVPACSSRELPPCWKLVSDEAGCPGPAGLRVEIVRAAAPPSDSVTTMRCQVL